MPRFPADQDKCNAFVEKRRQERDAAVKAREQSIAKAREELAKEYGVEAEMIVSTRGCS